MQEYGAQETIKAAYMKKGDWLVMIPTQEFPIWWAAEFDKRAGKKIRGVKLDSFITELSPYGKMDMAVKTTRSGTYLVPDFFEVIVRRPILEGSVA